MSEFINKLFYADFMGHGNCYLWKPEIIWLHAISDGLIALSYYFIPVMLAHLVRKRKDLPFHWMFFMFGVFILSCGTTHVMEIWTVWNGTYRLAGLIKAITAGASLATAVALVPLSSKAMLLPSPGQLRAANHELTKEIAERLRVEAALEEQSNLVVAVLNAVGTLIIVLDLDGMIVQCNRACEQISGYRTDQLMGRHVWDLFSIREEGERFQNMFEQTRSSFRPATFEGYWSAQSGGKSLISWSITVLTNASGNIRHVIASGVDITESKRLEKALLDISAREQARIGQDLHDGLGQHLTGVAFISKVLERKLADRSLAEATDAAKIVTLVNEAINKTRELARGLLPVSSDEAGLMSALERWTREVQNLFGVTCRFVCAEPVFIYNDNLATHLYRIAQEAVNNSIKHGYPSHIDISLAKIGAGIVMSINDNGVGLPEHAGGGGIGLRIMNYRAKMIGGTLQVRRGSEGGTIVTCHLRSGLVAG